MARRFDLVAYLKLFRFPLVFTAIADSAAGYLLGHGEWHFGTYGEEIGMLGKLALISGGLYLFGMSLNDLADRAKDSKNAPGKVLPSGRVSPKGAWIGSTAVLLVSFAALFLPPQKPSVPQIIIWLLTVAVIAAYDLGWGKFPPVMGLVRALNLCIGISVWENWRVWELPIICAPVFVYVTALTYVSTLEDTELDRKRLGVGLGFMGLGLLAAAIMVPAVRYGLRGSTDIRGRDEAILLILAWAVIGWLVRRAWKARDKKGVMLIIRDGVASIIFLDALLVASSGLWAWGLLVAGLIVPAAVSVAIFKRLV